MSQQKIKSSICVVADAEYLFKKELKIGALFLLACRAVGEHRLFDIFRPTACCTPRPLNTDSPVEGPLDLNPSQSLMTTTC